jgi:hypothetical protein
MRTDLIPVQQLPAPRTPRARRRATPPAPLTDRQRFEAVFKALTEHRVAHLFNTHGATGVREDRTNDLAALAERCGTDRVVGAHVGYTDDGGARWSDDGVLQVAIRKLPWKDPEWQPCEEVHWSYNHEIPELAELLVRLFVEQGIDAWWSGDEWDCVDIHLDRPRLPITAH